ncbi:hypothetical protein ColLi_12980 [Colletotrichum liriopes]|uniref:Uncharacterized protein n=1 Tax=Colletotrichum liriopes TaxID=708192 RepID=A0AA37GZX0_9PEZI|nr:hypothetical protein ColLi_12980 [Colletotrichum liriopes]
MTIDEPNQDIHNSNEFLCYKPISSYTRNGQKISFCRRCKGTIVRTLVEFKFDPLSPASSGSTSSNTSSVQDWLWHLCDLRPYPELQRFRPGFEEMIRHIGKELKRNGDEGDPVVGAKAAPGGEWTDNPVAAYVWWKSGCVRRAKERKGKDFVENDNQDCHRHSGSAKDHYDDGDGAVVAAAATTVHPQPLSAATISALSQLDGLRLQIVEACNKMREAVAVQAARDSADARLLACRKRVSQLQRRCSRSEGSAELAAVPVPLVERVKSASLALQEHEVKLATVTAEALASGMVLAQSSALDYLLQVSGIGQR